jgi:hypothetical protein
MPATPRRTPGKSWSVGDHPEGPNWLAHTILHTSPSTGKDRHANLA